MAEKQLTFRDLIAQNKESSFYLVVFFCFFVALVAVVLSLGVMASLTPGLLRVESHSQTSKIQPFEYHSVLSSPLEKPKINWTAAIGVGFIAGGIALAISFLGYFSGDSMILAMHGARPIQHDNDPELFNVVEEMALAAGIPMPRVYLIRDSALNAFATGRDPQHASVAITTGLREKLNREELQGVIAHEMSHIRNYDIRLMLLMAVLVGTIVMLCDLFWQLFQGGGRAGKRGGNLLMVIFVILAALLALLAPLLAQLIQLAVSRQREFLADATGVELTRNPLGLAHALRKINDDPGVLKTANRGTAHLYIANPIEKFQARAHTMFASHPPIEERIRRLEALAHVDSGGQTG